MRCPVCGNENVNGYEFCPECGAPLAESAGMEQVGANQSVQGSEMNNGVQPEGMNYGAQSNGMNYGAQPNGMNYGAQPNGMNYGAQPNGMNYGAQSDGTNYGAQSDGTNYGAQPNGMNYGAQPNGMNYGAQSNGMNYGAQPNGMNYGAQPNGMNYGAQGNASYGPGQMGKSIEKKKIFIIAGVAAAILTVVLIIVLSGGSAGASTKEGAIEKYLSAMNDKSIKGYQNARVPSELQSAEKEYQEKTYGYSYEEYVSLRFTNYGSKKYFDEIAEEKDVTSAKDLQKIIRKKYGDDTKVDAIYYVEYKYHVEDSTSTRRDDCYVYLYKGKWYWFE